MKIEKFKKLKNGRYDIMLEDGSSVNLFEDVIIKNELLIKKEVDLDTLDRLMDDNSKYESYDRALSLIDKKLRSEREIRNTLDDMGYDRNTINDTVDKLKSEKYIDDFMYAKSYVNDKVLLTNWGPYKISKALSELIEEEYIDEAISSIDDRLWRERLKKIIKKKESSFKNKSINFAKNSLREYLFDLGYDSDMISEEIESVSFNEEDALKKEMSKAYDKLSKKYSGEELNRQIKNHLYKKGFKVSNIE